MVGALESFDKPTGCGPLPYHLSRAIDALSQAARQSVRYSARMKSGVSEAHSAEARLMAISISFWNFSVLDIKANKSNADNRRGASAVVGYALGGGV